MNTPAVASVESVSQGSVPFPDGSGAFHILQALSDLVPLRRCKVLPKEKCLYYDIGKCIAPCIQACTDAEYQTLVDEVQALLRGRSAALVKEVQQGLVLSVSIVIHPMERIEGGLSQIEERALRELAIGAGASRVAVWVGDALTDEEVAGKLKGS